MKILFVTRKFPPSKGGMEKVSFDLYKVLSSQIDVLLIKWGGSNKWLPLVLPYLFMKSWLLLLKNRDISVVFLQDGLLSPIGYLLKIFFNKKVMIIIHGLDITFKNALYQLLIPRFISKLDKIICISNATKYECIKRNIPAHKINVIPNGISSDFCTGINKNQAKFILFKKFKFLEKYKDKKILLSVGRLVERKGYHWFINEVLPLILKERNDFVYLIVGDGKLRKLVEEIIRTKNLNEFVLLLGRVDDFTLKLLYRVADIFIMPNIPVEGDMEGFGVVALEANVCGLPVVAARIEGIKDVIKDGENGYIVPPLNSEKFYKKISMLLDNEVQRMTLSQRARYFVTKNFSWFSISKKYIECIKRMMTDSY